MTLEQLKERLKKKIGIKNLDEFLIRYNIEF